MKSNLSCIRHGDSESWATDLALLENPLEFIREDHMRMRAICEVMERTARSSLPDPADLSRLILFLEREIGLLIQDEDDVLHGLLLRRCKPLDEIEPTLTRMSRDHDILGESCPGLLETLGQMRDQARPATETEAEALCTFADRLRRHLIVENAIVLPIARARLSAEDIRYLQTAMIQRRITDMQA